MLSFFVIIGISSLAFRPSKTKELTTFPSPADRELPPHIKVDGQSHNGTRRQVVIDWIPKDPLRTERGPYTYYYDISKAFMSHNDVHQCRGAVGDCLRKLGPKSIFCPTFTHAFTSGSPITKIRRVATNTALSLRNSLAVMSNSTDRPCVSVVFMLNKVYQQLDEKVSALKRPFEIHGLLSKINMIATTWSPHAASWSKKYGMPFVYVPFASDTMRINLTFIPWENRTCDVFIRWDANPQKYQLRTRINQVLSGNQSDQLTDLKVQAPTGFLPEQQYIESIRDCKMHLSTIGMPGRVDLLGTRYYEIISSGTSLLMAQRPNSSESRFSYKAAGLEDGRTYVAFSDVTELLEKIRHYKINASGATAIIAEARKLSDRHSWQNRAARIVEGIQGLSKC